MKTEGFHAKIMCNLNDISYLSETQKNNFHSYNYNFFFIHSYSVSIIMFSLKNTFPANSLFRAFRLWRAYVDVVDVTTFKKSKWRPFSNWN